MSNMTTVEAKAFVPARDFALSKQFYQDLGFVADAAHCCPVRHGTLQAGKGLIRWRCRHEPSSNGSAVEGQY